MGQGSVPPSSNRTFLQTLTPRELQDLFRAAAAPAAAPAQTSVNDQEVIRGTAATPVFCWNVTFVCYFVDLSSDCDIAVLIQSVGGDTESVVSDGKTYPPALHQKIKRC